MFSTGLGIAKISVHWDHLLQPSILEAGTKEDHSWTGLAKRVSGLVLFAVSSLFIGVKPSLALFFGGGIYHHYKAYEKYTKLHPKELTESEKNEIETQKKAMNEKGIEALIKASNAGKKVGLIIGREKDQYIPQDDNWLWVSGNLDGEPEILKDRVHLQLDFDESDQCSKLKGLFDRVVVDDSTLKFLSTPWERFKMLLKPLPTSQLITETFRNISIRANGSTVGVDCSEEKSLH